MVFQTVSPTLIFSYVLARQAEMCALLVKMEEIPDKECFSNIRARLNDFTRVLSCIDAWKLNRTSQKNASIPVSGFLGSVDLYVDL